MHHRRKPDKPLTTRGKLSRIVTFRLPYDLEEAIKEIADRRGRPWQTVMKELLQEAVELSKPWAEVKRTSAKDLQEAARQLKRK